MPPCFPAVSTLQIYWAEGRATRSNPNHKFINKTENRCLPVGEVRLKRSGGGRWTVEETWHKVTGLAIVWFWQHQFVALIIAQGGNGFYFSRRMLLSTFWNIWYLVIILACIRISLWASQFLLCDNSYYVGLKRGGYSWREQSSSFLVGCTPTDHVPNLTEYFVYTRLFWCSWWKMGSSALCTLYISSPWHIHVAFPLTGPDQFGLGLQGAAAQRNHLPVCGVHQTEAKGYIWNPCSWW